MIGAERIERSIKHNKQSEITTEHLTSKHVSLGRNATSVKWDGSGNGMSDSGHIATKMNATNR